MSDTQTPASQTGGGLFRRGLLRMTTTGVPAPPVHVDGLDRLLDKGSEPRRTATVATLSSDRFAGRRLGSAGGAAARAWLGQHLADLGAASP